MCYLIVAKKVLISNQKWVYKCGRDIRCTIVYLLWDMHISTASSTLCRKVSSDVNITNSWAGDSSNNMPVILGASAWIQQKQWYHVGLKEIFEWSVFWAAIYRIYLSMGIQNWTEKLLRDNNISKKGLFLGSWIFHWILTLTALFRRCAFYFTIWYH